jgi:DNA-binding CsgD family transcriptional regulator
MSDQTTKDDIRQPLLGTTPFVGRGREIATLDAGVEMTRSGRGQLIVVTGEPGAGKTRLVEEFVAGDAARGSRVCWGRCDRWDAAPAYWPWVQVVRACLAVDDGEPSPAGDRTILADLARDPDQELTPNAGRDRGRFQLFESVSALLVRASLAQPLVVVIDDLHWADGPSLALLRHLVRELRSAPILMLVTCRSSDLDRLPGVTDMLAELAREPVHYRLELRGLAQAGTAAIVERALGWVPDNRLVEVVHHRTGGNPFFVTEVVRLAVSEGLLARAGDAVWSTRVPESAREVIEDRLRRLSPSCQELLAAAAVVGPEFHLSLLAQVTGTDALPAIEEAVAARIVEDARAIGRYRFCHILFQETLYAGLRLARRMELHRQVGETLERLAGDRLDGAAELARHFRAAAPLSSADKAIAYACRAAEAALDQHGWESAVAFYQQALEAFDLLDAPRPVERCETLLALGEAQNWAGEGRDRSVLAGVAPEAVETFRQAIALARSTGAARQLARAVLGLAGPNLGAPSSGNEGISLLEEALDALPDADDPLRARLMARVCVDQARRWGVGELQLSPGRPDPAARIEEAVAIARRVGDVPTLGYALAARFLTLESPEPDDSALAEAAEILRLADEPRIHARGHLQRYAALVRAGQIDDAAGALDELERLGRRVNAPIILWETAALRAGEALRRGQFRSAEAWLAEARSLWPQTAVSSYQLTTLRREQGRMAEVADVIDDRGARLPNNPGWRALRLVLQLECQRHDEARRGFERMASHGFLDIPRGFIWLRTMTWLAEVAAELRDRERARPLYDLLLPYRGQNLFTMTSDHTGGSVACYLGLLATTLSDWRSAEDHLRASLDDNEHWGNRPYVACTHDAWAALIHERDGGAGTPAALEHLDRAIALADEMGMARLANRARTRRDELLAGSFSPLTGHEPYGLSTREREVLRLIVDGYADREIAASLFISRRTVGSHVSHILTKLGVSTRTQATALAVREGLV